jgi:methionine synthase I (cobalamin-dependent)
VLLTNTFLINAATYRETLCRARVDADIRTSWCQALDLIGSDSVYRLAAVGPVAGATKPREFDDLARLSMPQACTHGPHGILLETCSSPRVRYALNSLRRRTEIPLLLSIAYYKEHRGKLISASGHPPEWFARRAQVYGAAALGVNCGVNMGMRETIEVIRRYREETDLPLFARPNAGTPIQRAGQWVYPHGPEAMAERLLDLLDAGVSMIGGCCGTTPAHIAAFRKVVTGWNARRMLANRR